MYTIRRAAGGPDFVAIHALDRKCFEAWVRSIDVDRGIFWVALNKGVIIAFAQLAPSASFEKTGYLARSAVHPEHRGNGLQLRLIKVRLRAAREFGWKYVVTDTTSNPHSANNLIKAGFKMYRPANPWSFASACYWIKEL